MMHSKRKGMKLLRSYFLTYAAVLLIPLAAFIICYGEAAKTIRLDIENENQALLRQAADILDVQMRELNEFGAQMANDPVISSLRSVEEPLAYPGIQSCIRVQNVLPTRAALSNFLFDYFIFFNRGQLALNDRFVYSYDDFYALYMHAAQSPAEWKAGILETPLSSGEEAVQHVTYLNGGAPEEKALITLTFSFLPFASSDGQIVLYVDQREFLDLLAAFHLETGDIAYIESKNGVVLAAVSPDDQAVAGLQAYFQDQPTHPDLIRARIGRQDMLISHYSSEKTGLGVTIARSADRAYARLNNIRWIIAVSLLISVLLGVLFSYLFSRRSSAFLRRLAFGSAAQKLSGMSYSEAFQSLRKSFEDIQIANDAMEKTLASQQPYLQKSFLTQLLNGDFANEENARAIARNIPSFRPDSPMRVLLLHFSGDSAFSSNPMDLQLSVNCKAVIRLSIDSLERDCLCMSQSESDYVLLLCGSRLEERIEALVRLIRSNLPEAISACLFAYAGNAVEKLTDVVRSWDNASSMIYIQPSPAEVPVQYYRENETARYDVFYPQDLQRRLINSMMNAEEQSVQEILNLLKEKNRQGAVIPAYIAQLLIDSLLSTLLQINTMSGLPAERSESILNSVKSLMALPTSAQLDMINTLYSSLCGAIHQLKSEGGKQQIMDEISAYIQEHYMEVDMSLTSVADQFHVSESYLSFTFKAQMGTNFFSFVENLRIAHAKALLRQTNLKISEIAEQSGYASANSFCRAFKRNTGESASNYRNGAEEG
ncbi:MAG: AraC family transcriptional regulator [Clostridia bacterium]|nr:AraC family transcriptional regulator [Clostridia bacterium]